MQEAMNFLFTVPRDIQDRIQMNLTYAELSLMSRASKRYPRMCQDNDIDPSRCLGWKFTQEDGENGKVPCAKCIISKDKISELLNEVNRATVDLRTAVGNGRSDAIKKALDTAIVAKQRLMRTEKYVQEKLQIKNLIAVLGNRIDITMKNLKNTHKNYEHLWTLPKGMDETVHFVNLQDWVVPALTDFTGYNQYARDVLMVEASSCESINKTVKDGEYNVLILDDDNHSIKANAFLDCHKLRSVTMPYTVTTIHAYAFRLCRTLKSVNMPKVTKVENSAFSYCSTLKSVNMPEVEIVEYGAFAHCATLKSVDMPLLTTVGGFAFYVCRNLNSVDMPLLTTVGKNAFTLCTSLKSVDMPLLTTVGVSAFNSCRSLKYVDMPLLETVGESAFEKCRNLQSVNMPLLKTVGKNAFVGCENLESVVMPLVTTVGKDAFVGCENLESVVMPLVTTVGKDAFERAPGSMRPGRTGHGRSVRSKSPRSDRGGSPRRDRSRSPGR